MTNPNRTRAQTARLHLARMRQALTGNYWRSRQPCPEPFGCAQESLVEGADPEPPRATPRDPEQGSPFDSAQESPEQRRRAARAERLMALLRGEEAP